MVGVGLNLLGNRWVMLAAVVAGLLIYDRVIDDPQVRRLARQGYIAEAEKAALQAEMQEVRRQKLAAEANALLWHQQLVRLQGEQDAREAEVEADIAEMEAKLKASGRSCPLTDDDIKWLRKRG